MIGTAYARLLRWLWVLPLFVPAAVLAQSAEGTLPNPDASVRTVPDTLRQLRDVVVTAAPFTLESARAPLSVVTRIRPGVERVTEPGASLADLGAGLPGVWISDRGNPSTGERLLVRGVGWRSAFGVRGSHVLLDDIPLTLPDGQAQLNVVDPALVRRVEVLRGPASTFWGSGSGGVIALSTEAGPGAPNVALRALGGGFGLYKAEAAVQPSLRRGRLSVWGSAVSQRGYRTHAASETFRLGASGRLPLGAGRSLQVVALGAYVPRAQSPGGLTPEQAAEDPRQSRAASIEQDAGKELTQGYLALSYAQPLTANARLATTVWGGLRTLDNPIVPRYIELDRATGGARATIEGTQVADRPVSWGLGLEVEAQRDDRLETTNDSGRPGADVLTSQLETVQSSAVFSRIALPFWDHGTGSWTATAALRADLITYEARPNGVDVGEPEERRRADGALSPSVGLTWTGARGLTVFVNGAGAFDAPTTTELGNRPDGRPGLNPSLSPERTWGAEVGARRTWARRNGFVRLDAAAFAARVSGLLVPREIDDVTVFDNGGRAETLGLELGVQAERLPLGPGRFSGACALTMVRASFLDNDDPDVPSGTRLPGIPPALATWTLTWSSHRTPLLNSRLVVGLSGEAVSAYDATIGGSDRTDGHAVLHLRIALSDVRLGGGVRATPFATVRNVTDARYAGSVVVNAFGGRFLEPAPERHVLVGVSVSLK
ncbi:MAG: TonB-dependent receptor [Bacteroidota bacterium]